MCFVLYAFPVFPPMQANETWMIPGISFYSPAHGVVVLRVAEAGGLQLAAHHGAGALVSSQVALQSTLAVHART